VSALGLRLTVLAGSIEGLPRPPLSPSFTARLRSVTVTENDEQRSVFTLMFDAGRCGLEGALDVPGIQASPVGPLARVVVELTFGALPSVLFDGIVTTLQLTPGDEPGGATLTVTGEDVSYLLDKKERTVEHPTLDDRSQVCEILKPYLKCGIVSTVLPPPHSNPRLASDGVPTQQRSDLAHLTELAGRNGFVAYIIPGPTRAASTFYWGPPVRGDRPQPALSVDLGAETTATLRFHTEALAPITVSGAVFDRGKCSSVPVNVSDSSRPQLAALPLQKTHNSDIRHRLLRDGGNDAVGAQARAQAEVDRSSDAVTARGTVDGARYGHVLRPRGLVGVRGAGWSHDGLWYVKEVVHELARGSYQQTITLTREGYGSTVPTVPLGGPG
jgi:hypothetical protein